MADLPPRDEKTEQIRERLQKLYSAREQRKIAEAVRQLDKALPPEQREALLRNAQSAAEIANNPAMRKALEGIDTAAITKAVEQLQRAEAARLVWERQMLDQAITWLSEKWKDSNCPYCGAADWQVGTPLEVSLGPGQAMSPAFPVMCGNCGHTTFVNAVLAGLVEPPEEDE